MAGRIAHPAAYSLLGVLDDVCPRPQYSPNGEERAWGRRLARRFGCDARYDDRSFRLSAHGSPEPVLDARTVKAGGKVVVELIGEVDPSNGEAVIAYGWAMAEALADGLATPPQLAVAAGARRSHHRVDLGAQLLTPGHRQPAGELLAHERGRRPRPRPDPRAAA